jgi:hypothetical protein
LCQSGRNTLLRFTESVCNGSTREFVRQKASCHKD